ncbi:MAG: hypothetical protein ACYDC1_06355 [Limisphaerales bacterium]
MSDTQILEAPYVPQPEPQILEEPAPPPPIVNPTLAQLEEMLRAPRTVTIRFDDGRPEVRLNVRSLTPAESEAVNLELRRVMVPMVQDAQGKPTSVPDKYNPEYLSALRRADLTARGVACYYGCEMIRSARPGLRDAVEITQYVQGLLTEPVLDLLYVGIVGGRTATEEYLANF